MYSAFIMAEYTASSRRKSGGTVTAECIQELLDFFIKSAYKAKNVDQRVCHHDHACVRSWKPGVAYRRRTLICIRLHHI
jgi:hypothetical protein